MEGDSIFAVEKKASRHEASRHQGIKGDQGGAQSASVKPGMRMPMRRPATTAWVTMSGGWMAGAPPQEERREEAAFGEGEVDVS